MWPELTLLTQFSGPVAYYTPVKTAVAAVLGHALLSGVLAYLVYRGMPRASEKSLWFGAMLLLTIFFLPGFGYFLGAAMLYWTRRHRPYAEHAFENVQSVMPSMFEQRSHSGKIEYAGSGIRYQLQGERLASDEKLRVLNSVVAMPGHRAVPILRSSMRDSAEDVRLVAYGMIDAREKEINEDIARAQALLEQAGDAEVRKDALRHLAMRYWDLVYFGLAEGEMLRFIFERIEYYARLALELDPDDGETLLVLGRLRLRRKEIDGADEYFSRAEACGIASSRVLLYRAEVAFYRRNFALVRDLLSVSHAFPNPGHFMTVLAFWRKRGSL